MTVVVFMVAGMSSRFGGTPKQLVKVGPNNETLIEYSVNQALTCNFTKLVFITNQNTEQHFINLFTYEYKGVPVLYVQQKYDISKRTRPWGTCDAICSLIGSIDEQFIMLNGDDIYGVNTFKKGFDEFNKTSNCLIGGCKVIDSIPESGSVNRGIIYVGKNGNVLRMKEMMNITKLNNPELHNELANMNFIGIKMEVLCMLNSILINFKQLHREDPKIECLLTDCLNQLIIENRFIMEHFLITDKIIGITNPGDEIIITQQISTNK